MAKLIIGLSGEMGAGKGTVAKYLSERYQGKSHRFSTMLRDILDRLYLPQSRDNMQVLSTELREIFGEELFARVMSEDVRNDTGELVIIDGIRRVADIKYLREFPHFKLFYLETDIEKRYERIHNRNENPDDMNLTFEQFKKDQEDESEMQIKELKGVTDFLVDNNGSFDELYKQVDQMVKELDLDIVHWDTGTGFHIKKDD
jgi:dephospho-CoA kinase